MARTRQDGGPGGVRAIEAFKVGDPALSRDEWDAGGTPTNERHPFKQTFRVVSQFGAVTRYSATGDAPEQDTTRMRSRFIGGSRR